MTLKLYYFPLSQPSRTVLAFLILNEIPFERHVIDIFKDEQKSAEYLNINPLGLIPAIDDDGFFLNESEAIIRYLIETRDIKEESYPKDPEQRALINRYMPFHQSQVTFNNIRYFRSSYPEIFTGLSYTLEEVKPELLTTYETFEKHYLKDNKYIAGDNLTFADLFAVNYISQVYYSTDFDYSHFPKLKAYIERVLENPVMKEVHGSIKQFGEELKKKKEAQKKQDTAQKEQKTIEKEQKTEKKEKKANKFVNNVDDAAKPSRRAKFLRILRYK